ncbi:TPA: hypothetical protein MW242_003103 [Acinetobacter baumannii]|nr:hypothetical protein [Acinetobacter baumannii]
MNFAIGFFIVMLVGMGVVVGVGQYLELKGYSENYILIAKILVAVLVICIPPLLAFTGRDYRSGNNLEKVGKPITGFFSFTGKALASMGLTTILLLIIINILIWK